jgi:hypothetical protein
MASTRTDRSGDSAALPARVRARYAGLRVLRRGRDADQRQEHDRLPRLPPGPPAAGAGPGPARPGPGTGPLGRAGAGRPAEGRTQPRLLPPVPRPQRGGAGAHGPVLVPGPARRGRPVPPRRRVRAGRAPGPGAHDRAHLGLVRTVPGPHRPARGRRPGAVHPPAVPGRGAHRRGGRPHDRTPQGAGGALDAHPPRREPQGELRLRGRRQRPAAAADGGAPGRGRRGPAPHSWAAAGGWTTLPAAGRRAARPPIRR